jgi:transposase-like protein
VEGQLPQRVRSEVGGDRHGPDGARAAQGSPGEFRTAADRPRYQRRFLGFDDKIILKHVRSMSTREIVGHLRDLYGIEVTPDLISEVEDAVLADVAVWQSRPLEPVYPLVLFNALWVKIRVSGSRQSLPY